jgi:hypothetical protein
MPTVDRSISSDFVRHAQRDELGGWSTRAFATLVDADRGRAGLQLSHFALSGYSSQRPTRAMPLQPR